MWTDMCPIMWTNMSFPFWNLADRYSRLDTTGQIGIGLLAVYASYVGVSTIYSLYKQAANNKIRSKKQKENAQSIEDLAERLRKNPLSDSQITYITRLNLDELHTELVEGRLRPLVVLQAYQTKALEAHRRTNCLVEVITEAEEWALELESGAREGALWGVPISIKDDVGIKGYDSTMGMVERIGKPAIHDSNVIQALRREGAIPFVKTNVPQAEISFEPGNPINGIVHNPYRHGYGPGGSSSGEAALIASGASLLGIGSDLAGSIRIPSHFCGVCGFKPTSERISPRWMSIDNLAVIPIRNVWGPMARDVDGLVTVLETLWQRGKHSKTDPECVPMPFDSQTYKSKEKVRIGYYTDGEQSPTFSGCVRAVEMAKRVLSDLGHELVPWQPPDVKGNLALVVKVFGADGGKALKDMLYYDVLDKTVKEKRLYTPFWIRRLLALLMYPWDPFMSEMIKASCGIGTVASYDELKYELWERRRMVQDSWNEAGLDAVICPPHPMVAPPLGNSMLLIQTGIFTVTYNLLHCPSGVIPATHVTQADIDRLQQDFPPGGRVNDAVRKAMLDTIDLPVGVMVASSRYQDETCLRVMKMLEQGLKKEHKMKSS